MPLDRPHLELLQALADHQTLRAAATSINLSPSAASRRLDDAERRVGVALTHTPGRSLELTDEPTVESLTRQFAEGDYRIAPLIQLVVASEAFQSK